MAVTAKDIDQMLADDMAAFYADPYGFVMYAYEWGTGELEGFDGPDQWQKDFLVSWGEEIKRNGFDGVNPVPPIRRATASGHGIGKEIRYLSVIPTPDGLVQWGDIMPGMRVFGINGLPTKVVARHEQGIKDIHKVLFDDGSSEYVGLEHLWNVKGRQERRKCVDEWRTLSTKEIIDLGVKRKNGVGMARQWEIPTCDPVSFTEKDVFSPYTVGVWLGDGSSSGGQINSSFDEIWDKLPETVNPLKYDERRAGGKFREGTIIGLTKALRKYNMLDVSCDTKHIGEAYKFNSIKMRKALVCGMLDTDGEVHESGSIGYCSTSKQLVEDIIWMVRSLGGKAMMHPSVKKAGYKDSDGIFHKCKDAYRCTINIDWNPFSVKHKKEAFKISESRYRKRWIESIEYSHKEKAMCITVDADDGLFLATDFIVTHNSALTAWCVNFIMSTRPGAKGTVTANTSVQLETKTWAEIGKWTNRCITKDWFTVTSGRGSMKMYHKQHKESWFCSAQTCREENSESFAGQHAVTSTPFYIFDEASAVPDGIYEVAEGGLTDGEPMMFLFGNPTKNTGKFVECFKKMRHRWETKQIDSRDVKITNKAQLQEWVDDYGEDSDFVRVRVRGVFPRSGSTQFIGNDIVEDAKGKPIHVSQYIDRPKILGVDIARFGDDQTVFITRQGLAAYGLKKFRGQNTQSIAGLIAQEIKKHDFDAVFLDMGNIGAAVYDLLSEWGYDITGVWFGSGATNKKDYFNKRAEMWGETKKWLEDGGAIPDDNELCDDLIGPEYGYTSTEQIQLEQKKDMKKRGLASPDCGDALVLTKAYPVAKKTDKLSKAKRHEKAKSDYSLFGSSAMPKQKAKTNYNMFGYDN